MTPGNDDPLDSLTATSEKIPLNNRYNAQIVSDLDNKLNNNNHQPNTNNYTKNLQLYGANGTGKDTKQHRWSALPQDDTKLSNSAGGLVDNQNAIAVNNNEWKTIPSNSKDDINNGWKEVPQIDDNSGGEEGGGHKILGNNNGSVTNGNTGLGNGNGHPEKFSLDQDILTTYQGRLQDLDEISSCGIGACQPKWAKSFASTHVFMVVFLLAWVLQGMYYTYFVSVITTIEKLFQIKSKITGLLMSATEIGQISTSLFLTYYAGRGHRPRWIACGMILFALSSFSCTLPHFIFGDQLLHASNVFNGGVSNPLTNSTNMNLCTVGGNHSFTHESKECESEILIEQAAHSQITTIVLIIFSISLLGVGVGQTAVSTLGIPYIDDNVASRESPIYIAITIGVRILGPASGFILGSICTSVYVDVTTDSGLSPSDPKWVGAWWLGLVLISSLMALTSLAMFTFPKHLKGNRIPPPMKLRAMEAQKKQIKQEEEPKTPQLKDFPKTIKRQLSNDILMFRTASSVLHLLPVAGLYTFLPKYLETQFRLTATDANMISGVGGILVMGIGIVISGVVILKTSPTARSVAAWIAFCALTYACGMATLMFIGCPMDDFRGLKLNNEPPLPKFEPVCNLSCDCDFDKFSPICGADGMTYFSACHAGCSTYKKESGKTEFGDCLCIENMYKNVSQVEFKKPDATSGYCDGNCQNFVWFISLFSFFVFMHSTSEVGSMLLIMRCTDPKDKAMAMGIIQFAIGLFGNVPCPIIYGAVVDSACLVWETICGKQGACSLYDVDMFRHFFLGTTSGIMVLAFIMDLVVWKKAHRIDIDPENSNSDADMEKTVVAVVVPDTTV